MPRAGLGSEAGTLSVVFLLWEWAEGADLQPGPCPAFYHPPRTDRPVEAGTVEVNLLLLPLVCVPSGSGLALPVSFRRCTFPTTCFC